MDFSVSPFIAYILALSGTCGFIWFLFSKAEDTLNDETKKSISDWLKNLDPIEPATNWPEQFAAVFDRIFGQKHLSWRCFSRSCIASIISVIIMIIVWESIWPLRVDTFFQKYDVGGGLGVLLFGSIL